VTHSRGGEKVISQGLKQTSDYVRRVGADEAHLIIFNRSKGRSWDEKIWRREELFEDLTITIWGV